MKRYLQKKRSILYILKEEMSLALQQSTLDEALLVGNEHVHNIGLCFLWQEAQFVTWWDRVIILTALRHSIVTTNVEFFYMGNKNRRGPIHECIYHKFFARANDSCLDADSLTTKLVFYFYITGHTWLSQEKSWMWRHACIDPANINYSQATTSKAWTYCRDD